LALTASLLARTLAQWTRQARPAAAAPVHHSSRKPGRRHRASASCARSSLGGAASCCASWATMLDPAATLKLAERVAEEAARLGFEAVLIGAAALAVHRYTRGTEDIDLAVVVDPHVQLRALEQAL